MQLQKVDLLQPAFPLDVFLYSFLSISCCLSGSLFSFALFSFQDYYFVVFNFLDFCVFVCLITFMLVFVLLPVLKSLFPLKADFQILAQWFDERIHNTGYFKYISKNLTSEQTMKCEFCISSVLWRVFLFLTWSVTTGRWSGCEFGTWEQFNSSPSSSLDLRPQNKVKDPCSTCWSLSRSV